MLNSLIFFAFSFQQNIHSKMNCVRKVGVGVGLISFLAWLGISLKSLVSPEEKSLLVEVFTNRNLVNFMMGKMTIDYCKKFSKKKLKKFELS